MKQLVLLLINGYQRLAPIRKALMMQLFHVDRSCRFIPSCSEYTVQAVTKYGAVKGLILGLKRLIRCRPGVSGGIDRVV